MKKIILILIAIISVALIGTGIFFLINESDNKKNNSSVDDTSIGRFEIDDELEENNIITENVHGYRTLEDAVDYLKSSYTTEDVVVTNKGVDKITIKVFMGTEEEVTYNYFNGSGDLLINIKR